MFFNRNTQIQVIYMKFHGTLHCYIFIIFHVNKNNGQNQLNKTKQAYLV